MLPKWLLGLLLAAGLLWAPGVAAADPLIADINGDGLPDQVGEGHEPSELVVRLARSLTVQHLDAGAAIVHVATVDINRDGRVDLVASTSHSGLRLWVQRHGRFVTKKAHQAVTRVSDKPHPWSSVGVRRVAASARDAADGTASGAVAERTGTHTFSLDSTAVSFRISSTRTLSSFVRPSIPRGPPAFFL